MTNLTPIINALILLIAAILSVYVIPLIKAHVKRKDLDILEKWVTVGVGAAEQLFDKSEWEKKREYVFEFMREHGYVIDETVINTLENAVLKLHHQLYSYDKGELTK